jgi:hypothetical protein
MNVSTCAAFLTRVQRLDRRVHRNRVAPLIPTLSEKGYDHKVELSTALKTWADHVERFGTPGEGVTRNRWFDTFDAASSSCCRSKCPTFPIPPNSGEANPGPSRYARLAFNQSHSQRCTAGASTLQRRRLRLIGAMTSCYRGIRGAASGETEQRKRLTSEEGVLDRRRATSRYE